MTPEAERDDLVVRCSTLQADLDAVATLLACHGGQGERLAHPETRRDEIRATLARIGRRIGALEANATGRRIGSEPTLRAGWRETVVRFACQLAPPTQTFSRATVDTTIELLGQAAGMAQVADQLEARHEGLVREIRRILARTASAHEPAGQALHDIARLVAPPTAAEQRRTLQCLAQMGPFPGVDEQAFQAHLKGLDEEMVRAAFPKPEPPDGHPDPTCPRCGADIRWGIGEHGTGAAHCSRSGYATVRSGPPVPPTCDWRGQVYRDPAGQVRVMPELQPDHVTVSSAPPSIHRCGPEWGPVLVGQIEAPAGKVWISYSAEVDPEDDGQVWVAAAVLVGGEVRLITQTERHVSRPTSGVGSLMWYRADAGPGTHRFALVACGVGQVGPARLELSLREPRGRG